MVLSLYDARRLSHKTQEQTAKHINVHVATYRKYEKDSKKVPICIAHKLAEYFDIPFNEINFFNQ